MLRSRLGLVKRCVTVQSGESLVPISVQQQPHHVLTKAPPLGHIGKERVKESSILLQRPRGGWGRFTFAHGSTSAPFYPYSVRLQQSNVRAAAGTKASTPAGRWEKRAYLCRGWETRSGPVHVMF